MLIMDNSVDNVVDEAGGITQHQTQFHNDQKILDTGHAAFSKSERGNLTDVSVLVVAADDGFASNR